MKISRVNAPSCSGGENPLWDADAGQLYYIDNAGCKVHRFDPASGATRSWDLPTVITTLALRASGGAVVTLRSGIHFWDPETNALATIAPLADPPPHVYNDGKVDRRGRFVIGACTPNFANPDNSGGLFRLDPDHSLTRIDGDIHYSNSPCWSPDDRTFYFADSWRRTLYAYDYDIETGAVANRRPFADTSDLGGMPDGAAVDRDGLVWIAIYGGGKIAAYRPDGGLERVIDMPVRLVSSVAFGGPDLDRLFVTTIAHGPLGEPVEEGAGDLYVIDGLGTHGLVEPRFLG
jgi:sugar lactone lactonase YvrE